MRTLSMLDFIFLQASGGQGGGMVQILFFAGIILVFYFFMIRPQQKRQKEARKFQEEIKKGAQVVTVGGVHGKVFEVLDLEVILDVGGNVKLKVDKSALSMESTKRLTEPEKK